ncbi:indole-3-glycerol phosphate synthase [hydrocarbon metagenome]|uniref:indole-3-glycerol-phosphate synthase n=1 Tax=hydrocarbon metagenome TaxID=938273 RepID=A0A0W8E367_9ZZZZ
MLNRIATAKQLEVLRLKSAVDKDTLMIKSKKFDLFSVFKNDSRLEIIAELKKASPIKGVICRSFDHLEIARKYEQNGAAAVSVISDSKFFDGKTDYLREVREEIEIPILRKDFIIDQIQLYETLSLGADMVLLIAALHDYQDLLYLCEKSLEIGLEPLVEIHDAGEARVALDLPVHMIGVNNRNLQDFTVDIKRSIELVNLIPDSFIKVSESGIRTSEDLALLETHGFDAVLIGEALVSDPCPGHKLKELLQYERINRYDQG